MLGFDAGARSVATRLLCLQLTAFFTSAPILASSAAVSSFSAKAVGHMGAFVEARPACSSPPPSCSWRCAAYRVDLFFRRFFLPGIPACFFSFASSLSDNLVGLGGLEIGDYHVDDQRPQATRRGVSPDWLRCRRPSGQFPVVSTKVFIISKNSIIPNIPKSPLDWNTR
jgi:hypothetical protein